MNIGGKLIMSSEGLARYNHCPLRPIWLSHHLAIISVGIAGLLSAQAQAQDQITLHGVVRDAKTRLAISCATVSAVGDQAAAPDCTDGSGEFDIILNRQIKIGAQVRIRVEKANYEPFDMKEVASPNQIIQVELTPKASEAPSIKHVLVPAQRFATNAGIRASAGQKFTIKARGTVNLATEGPYIVDADGTVITAPADGTGAQSWFKNLASPRGTLPVKGAKKLLLAPNDVDHLAGAPCGALIAGFSQVPYPKSISDFPSGFVLVGSSGTVVAPFGGGYLFLAVNDYYLPDNDGSFDVNITPAKKN
jgi:hypothetical protein